MFLISDACRNDWGSELASIHSTEDHEESSGMCEVKYCHQNGNKIVLVILPRVFKFGLFSL